MFLLFYRWWVQKGSDRQPIDARASSLSRNSLNIGHRNSNGKPSRQELLFLPTGHSVLRSISSSYSYQTKIVCEAYNDVGSSMMEVRIKII